jgi:hypothetical protein
VGRPVDHEQLAVEGVERPEPKPPWVSSSPIVISPSSTPSSRALLTLTWKISWR